MADIKFKDLSEKEQVLLNFAEKALINAHNPYSNKTRVGAAVRMKTGEIVMGSSIATSSSSVNLCAERIAIGNANTMGLKGIVALAVIGTDSDGVIEKPVMPCGICRQFMEEFMPADGGDIEIICSNSSKTKIIRTSLKKLLPLPYLGNTV
jgi:cytidine deaminase